MQIKTLEIRDTGTFIPVIAISTSPSNSEQEYLLRRSGYSATSDSECIILCKLNCPGTDYNATYDPFSWSGSRTLHEAHKWLQGHFPEVKDGDVIDVEFILGEIQKPKISEKYECTY